MPGTDDICEPYGPAMFGAMLLMCLSAYILPTVAFFWVPRFEQMEA